LSFEVLLDFIGNFQNYRIVICVLQLARVEVVSYKVLALCVLDLDLETFGSEIDNGFVVWYLYLEFIFF
jgi:hypothetical protein